MFFLQNRRIYRSIHCPMAMLKEEREEYLRKKERLRFARKLRKSMTSAEKILWNELRNRKLNNCKFRRQAIVGSYIVDFLCEHERLVIEVDGSIHDSEGHQERDIGRENLLKERKYRVIRFTNEEVENALPMVLKKISEHIYNIHSPSPEYREYIK